MRRSPVVVSRFLALWSTLVVAACSPVAVPSPTGDNRFSGPWHGDYEGAGCFSNPAFAIADQDVTVTVRVADLGDNHIRINLFITPHTEAYSPVLRVEGQLVRSNQAELVMLDEVTYQHASLVRTADGEISGTLWVTSLADGLYWKCTIEANPSPGV
jgi:hypothetical protein